jgi:hypothetical protein
VAAATEGFQVLAEGFINRLGMCCCCCAFSV